MKTNIINQFSNPAIQEWETDDGVNFAIALARITGWLLYVDWLKLTVDEQDVDKMKSLRVYVSNNTNQIYDFTGIYKLEDFVNNVTEPLVKERGANYKGGSTRYYGESKLFTLPLRVKPDEVKIKAAYELIIDNTDYLDNIPKRQEPCVPAHIAAKFTFGQCNPFATALYDLKGYKPIALIAKEYNKRFDLSKLGYVHSFAFDRDGNATDIWGKDTIENMAKRFELTKYELDETEHFKVSQTLKRNCPNEYNEIYEESVAIINEYFI